MHASSADAFSVAAHVLNLTDFCQTCKMKFWELSKTALMIVHKDSLRRSSYARAPFSHFVSKRARISSIALELRLRSGDSPPSASARSSLRLAGEGDHDTAAGVSALAASLAATRSRRTRSASSAAVAPSDGASSAGRVASRPRRDIGAFAGDAAAEGAREAFAELGMDDRAERKPSEARDGDGSGEKKTDSARVVGEDAFELSAWFPRRENKRIAPPPPPPGPGRRAGGALGVAARSPLAGDPPGVVDAEAFETVVCETNDGTNDRSSFRRGGFPGTGFPAAGVRSGVRSSEEAPFPTRASENPNGNPKNTSAVSRATASDHTFPSLLRVCSASASFARHLARIERRSAETRARAAAATSGPTVAASRASRVSRRSAASTPF